MRKGFTLIELLVVIAIIGILSSIVLASLNTARGKGSDAAAQEEINNIRANAEIFYSIGNTYAGVCGAASVVQQMKAAAAVEGLTWASISDNSVKITCVDSANAYDVSLQLPKGAGTGFYWCIDNTGTAKLETSMTATQTACTP